MTANVQEQAMNEAVLARAELSSLIRAAGADAIVGITSDELGAAAPRVSELPDWIEGATEVVAHPEIAVVIARDVRQIGRQFFYHYLAGEHAVERTVLPTGDDRLEQLGGRDAMIARIVELMPVESVSGGESFRIEQAELFAAKALAEDWQTQAAEAVFASHGASDAGARSLVASIQQPRFGGTLSVLAVAGGEIVDARDFGVVQGDTDGWLMTQTVAGEPEMTVRQVTSSELATTVAGAIAELKAV